MRSYKNRGGDSPPDGQLGQSPYELIATNCVGPPLIPLYTKRSIASPYELITEIPFGGIISLMRGSSLQSLGTIRLDLKNFTFALPK